MRIVHVDVWVLPDQVEAFREATSAPRATAVEQWETPR